MGNPFTRDEKKALQKRREAEILQMKQNLDEQIEERKKVREQGGKSALQGKRVREQLNILQDDIKPNTCIEQARINKTNLEENNDPKLVEDIPSTKVTTS